MRHRRRPGDAGTRLLCEVPARPRRRRRRRRRWHRPRPSHPGDDVDDAGDLVDHVDLVDDDVGGSTTTSSSPAPSLASTSRGVRSADAAQLQFIGPWDDGAAIPVEYTCDGADDVPLITWTAPPDGTAELALSVIDPDADGFVHWLVIGLPAEAGSVGGGEPLVDGAAEAINSLRQPRVGRAVPAAWRRPAHVPVHAARPRPAVELPADTPTNDLLAAVEAATARSATFTGTYERA